MAALQPHVVVVVDDEATVRTTARAILTCAGFEVQVAEDGRGALALLQALGRSIAVVVLDWTLPDVAGRDILAEIERLAPDARVIVSTGFGREDLTLSQAEAQRVTFLEKPYTASALIDAVRARFDITAHEGTATS